MRLAELLEILAQKGVTLQCQDGQLVLEGHVDTLSSSEIQALKKYKHEIIGLSGEKSNVFDIAICTRAHAYSTQMTSHQKSMYLLESLAEQPYYNLPVAYKITGSLQLDKLQHAFNRLIANNDVLRTIYSKPEETQHIQSQHDFVLPHSKLRDEASLVEALKCEANYRFDLSKEWPIRVHVYELDTYYVLSINIHHIAADGFSAKVILQTLAAEYAQPCSTVHRVAQYADFSDWQQAYLTSDHAKEGVTYWQALLEGVSSCHNFPIQYPRPTTLSVQGKRWKQTLNKDLSSQLKQCAQEQGVSSFSLLQSVFACYLSRMSDSQDIVFGSVYGNRSGENVANTVGMFANTLPFRFQFSAEDSLSTAVIQCQKLVKNAKQYQYVPFEQIVELANIERQANHLPLVQIMLVAQDNALEQFRLDGCQVELMDNDQDVSKFDFSIHIYTKGEQLEFVWEYNTHLFSDDWVQHLARYLEHFIAQLIASPTMAFSSIHFKHDATAEIIEPNRFPVFKSLPELITEQASDYANRVAISHYSEQLTYGQLVDRLSRAASHFLDTHYAPKSRIGVYMEKSIDMVVAMLAIMRAGYTYVPLDPSYPQARVAQICQNAELACVVTQDGHFPINNSQSHFEVVTVAQLQKSEVKVAYPVLTEADIAYVLYTSGSTGVPKGVAVPHSSIYYSLQANKEVFNFNKNDTMPTIGSQAFGVSLLEILVPLLSGGKIEIITRDDVSLLPQLIEKTQQVSVLHAVPSLMGPWIDEVKAYGDDCYPDLRLLLVGGEPVPDTLLKKIHAWREDVEVRVLYGMTESSVVSSSYNPKSVSALNYCIGQPHPNVNYLVMNQFGAIQPKGLSGELYVAGLSLAAAYVGNKQQTDKHFTYDESTAQRVYKTGDRVKCHLDGHYEFLGRLDNQISLRGVRIELGEIESCVNDISVVTHCVVHPQLMNDTDVLLVLYYSIKYGADSEDALAQIKAQLTEHLPVSMRPTLFSQLDALPLNANGKIDRKSLPIPQLKSVYIAPATPTEKTMQNLWCDLFELDSISVEDNFFELGGHSLLASKLVAKANDIFQVSLSISAFFTAPTIRLCAMKIDSERDKNKLQLLQATIVNDSNSEELIF
ncbi:non-ribosomal peptide synthetase [Pseudoalteromonas sp. MMG012]|uniref:non-ribosomal peptide synthetase n=1 Tax=Pseudoalteromonas sp. MMG012 TaxID=2822686 RepID=UPI001B3A2074|nr:non-ribosomal peptide synthetase [Pseudoalteromonas sp. MMG012]MBQ4850307.1 amino acid adenylation domain-containing protein [Pseudoalteromonas sp. MMG012]